MTKPRLVKPQLETNIPNNKKIKFLINFSPIFEIACPIYGPVNRISPKTGHGRISKEKN